MTSSQWNRVEIPPSPPAATGLPDLLAHPGEWMLLATRDLPAPGEQMPPWRYPGIPLADLEAERQRLLLAADANVVFLPQRRIAAGWQWLGLAFPPSIRPKVKAAQPKRKAERSIKTSLQRVVG